MQDPAPGITAIVGPAGLRTYNGGKGGAGVAQWIINHVPPHDTYIEAFIGSGRVMRMKRPARHNHAFDLDHAVIEQWRGVPGVTVEWGDARALLLQLRNYLSPSTFVYCDPPYLMTTRTSQRDLYDVEFSTEAEHEHLIRILRSLPCMVALSGYHSDLYARLLGDWRLSKFQTVDRGGKPRVEHLWTNYAAPDVLHDWRYFGASFGARQQFKRKVGRWQRRLAAMPTLERNALFAHLAESGHAAGHMVGPGLAVPIATPGCSGRTPEATACPAPKAQPL